MSLLLKQLRDELLNLLGQDAEQKVEATVASILNCGSVDPEAVAYWNGRVDAWIKVIEVVESAITMAGVEISYERSKDQWPTTM